jgi:ABC-type transport system involved in cytochrome bd biosynthesis fused ATPase/permease subunit
LIVFPIDLLSGIIFLVTAPLIPFFMIMIGKGVEIVDEILVMDNGHIVERGTHAELIKVEGLYFSLLSLQNRILEHKI